MFCWLKQYSEEEYDWLLSSSVLFPSLLPLLQECQEASEDGLTPSILILGCGNSSLSADLKEEGFSNITSLDFSPIVIEHMQEKHPDMRWVEGDMRCLEEIFAEEVFSSSFFYLFFTFSFLLAV